MEQKKIDRISELTRISRTRELTEEEQKERAILRREYIDSYKASLTGILENTYIQEPDGTKHKLEKKKKWFLGHNNLCKDEKGDYLC